jgi:hypothetical protein
MSAMKNLIEEICEMHHQGMEVWLIAMLIDMRIAEVQAIVNEYSENLKAN